jgi:glutamine amidotransferase
VAERRAPVAIVDYGLGNLFSVEHACAWAGIDAVVTSAATEILAAPAVIMPGVGAFGDAMVTLRRLDLVAVLRDVVAAGTPLLGICLGMQLLMTESQEFGRHRGLGLVEGEVRRLATGTATAVKVPHVGWSAVDAVADWRPTPLAGIADGAFMYFVHSYAVVPAAEDVVVATTEYGPNRFCSALRRANVFACQFHPERSGREGLTVYRNLAAHLGARATEREHV